MFEYKTMSFKPSGFWGGKVDGNNIEAALNGLASQDWELVHAVPVAATYGATTEILCIFKRKSPKN